MLAAGIACRRAASRSRSALAAFSTNCHGVSGQLSDPAAASPSSSGPFLYGNRREQVLHISQFVEANGKRAFLVDTIALARRMEAQGVPSKHTEAIVSVITEILNDNHENVAQLIVSKGEMQKSKTIHDANFSKILSQMLSSQDYDMCP